MVRLARERLMEAKDKIRTGKPLTIQESLGVLVDGFEYFQKRSRPSTISGVSLIRVAGQAVGMKDEHSRDEVLGLLKSIKPGGAFLVLGHGGKTTCGAVGAKKKQVELEKEGKLMDEHSSIIGLLGNIPAEVHKHESPIAEFENAKWQATKIHLDAEFGEIIKKRDITVVCAVLDEDILYVALNRDEEKARFVAEKMAEMGISKNEYEEKCLQDRFFDDRIFEQKLSIGLHPKLSALREQLKKGFMKVERDRIDLATHYAHAIFTYDPMLMRTVLDPFEPYLDIGGVCCVDARLTPNVPDGPKYLFRTPPNSLFMVTIGMHNGAIKFSYDDKGSIAYALKHVNGVNSLANEGHGEAGNGHIVCLDTSLGFYRASKVKEELLKDEHFLGATMEGKTITLAGFDGKQLRISNQDHGVEITMDYKPQTNILSL